MMPRCRNGRGGSPLLLGLPRAARLGLGSFSRVLRPVLPALVGRPESSRLCTPVRCCSDVSPPGRGQGTSAWQQAWGHSSDLVSWSPACFVLVSRIRALISTTHCTFRVFAVTEGSLKMDLKAKINEPLGLSPPRRLYTAMVVGSGVALSSLSSTRIHFSFPNYNIYFSLKNTPPAIVTQ